MNVLIMTENPTPPHTPPSNKNKKKKKINSILI